MAMEKDSDAEHDQLISQFQEVRDDIARIEAGRAGSFRLALLLGFVIAAGMTFYGYSQEGHTPQDRPRLIEIFLEAGWIGFWSSYMRGFQSTRKLLREKNALLLKLSGKKQPDDIGGVIFATIGYLCVLATIPFALLELIVRLVLKN